MTNAGMLGDGTLIEESIERSVEVCPGICRIQTEQTSTYACYQTGVMVDKRHVLTTAHGNRSSNPKVQVWIKGDIIERSGEEVFFHPSFNKHALEKGRFAEGDVTDSIQSIGTDLALIRLNHPINSSYLPLVRTDPVNWKPNLRCFTACAQSLLYLSDDSEGIHELFGEERRTPPHLLSMRIEEFGQSKIIAQKTELVWQSNPLKLSFKRPFDHRLQGTLLPGDSGTPLIANIAGHFTCVGICSDSEVVVYPTERFHPLLEFLQIKFEFTKRMFPTSVTPYFVPLYTRQNQVWINSIIHA